MTVSKSDSAFKGLSQVARIELESSVNGRLALYEQDGLMAAFRREVSKMNKPFLPTLLYTCF